MRNRVRSFIFALLCWSSGFISSTVLTKPLLWQFLLVDAPDVEPLLLAIGVFAHHHLPIRVSPAVAVPGLV